MCQPHWDQLRSDVSKYGLDHLVAPDGKAAVEMMVRQIEGKDGPLDFDPLMNAHNALTGIALDLIGRRLMTPTDDGGQRCPACELRDYNWVEGAAFQSRLYAEKNGLLLDMPQAP